jgi:anti-anti-sigma regulatory factor
MGHDHGISELEREAAASPEDRLLQRRLDMALLRSGRRERVFERLQARLSCDARWCRLPGLERQENGEIVSRLCSCCRKPVSFCYQPLALMDLAKQDHCIATSRETASELINELIDNFLEDDYREPHCLMTVSNYGQLIVSGAEGVTPLGQSYRVFDIEGRFDGLEAGASRPFYEEIEGAAEHYKFVIMTMARLQYFDDMAFRLFLNADTLLKARGGSLILASIPSGYMVALRMLAGTAVELIDNVFATETEAIAAIDRRLS